ncbi:MAG: hypothetical protein [Microviridae sp.]|nr:MAG: hypothetical protein [Microviridae sp.]
MSSSTQTKPKGILSTSMNAEETPNQNSALIERFPIEGTPFTVWSDYRGEKQKYYSTMGDYKISDDCDTQEEAREWHLNHFWEVIVQLVVIVNEKTEQIKKIKEEIPQG